MAKSIDAKALKALLSEKDEIALVDVRELGPYSQGHPFFANPIPYSRLELDLPRLVPRAATRIVLLDGGSDGIAAKAAARAEAMGYTDVTVLAGGAAGWKAAGYTLYEGVNVPSKAFGEVIEIERHTPRITARDLVAMKSRAENMVIVDGRTWVEYQNFNIPGGISCPNAELPLRIDRLAPDPKTTIVVNCAGRTRSIIGAQTLIDCGVVNKVVALENGTQAWWLEGLQVERGADRQAPGATSDTAMLASKRAKVAAHAGKHGVRAVSGAQLMGWLTDGSRTVYRFDIREAAEHAAGCPASFVHAPGGQLVQATDQWVATRGATIVLFDTDGIRAPMTAAWLRQLGHDAMTVTPADAEMVAGVALAGSVKSTPLPPLPPMAADVVAKSLADGTRRMIDVRGSMAYRKAHVPGAVWSIRPRIAAKAAGAAIVLVADDPGVATLAARDLAEAGAKDVALLAGGFAAWQQAGLPVAATPAEPGDGDCVDFIFHTLGRNEGNLDAARAYLKWEIDLTEQLDAQERGSFRL